MTLAAARVSMVCLLATSLHATPCGASPDAPAAPSPTTVERIRSAGVLTCGGVPRPGLASVDGDGLWSGLEVEICRAVAAAVFGPNARVSWHSYESDTDFDRVRAGDDRLSFLSFAEMEQHKLAGRLLPGPTVFAETYDLLVADRSPARQPSDLVGQGVCFIIGTAVENSLESWFRDHRLEFVPRAFQEDDEMYDAFAVQRCTAVVGESTTLAAARRNRGVNGLVGRLMPEHLGAFPIIAAIPLSDDAQWAAIVALTVATLVNAEARQTLKHPGGLQAITVGGEGLGLAPGWQEAVVEAVGSYSAIFHRALGEGSPLHLPAGLNARRVEGGVFVPLQRN